MFVLPNDQCRTIFENFDFVELFDDMVCSVGPNAETTCRGDSGGPLTVEVNGKETLIGTTSYGIANCNIQFPTVFTRIVPYLEWISVASTL